MRVQEHVWIFDKCQACGAHRYQGSDTDQRSCVWREDGILKQSLRPEPARRPLVHEDAETIARRIREIRADVAWAQSVANCAAMDGLPQSVCEECAPDLHCKACARRRDELVAQCPICWRTPTKPCPSRE